MSFKPRPNTFTVYRLFFTLTLLIGGGIVLCTIALEGLGWISLLGEGSGIDREALLVSGTVGGCLGVLYGSMLLYLISDRRGEKGDRRQRRIPIDFPDRRSGVDRRKPLEEMQGLQLCQNGRILSEPQMRT